MAQKLYDAMNNKVMEEHETEKETTVEGLMDFAREYVDQQRVEYEENKSKKALTFGKWKGFKVAELAQTEKGRSYLTWLLSQTWCTEDKFKYIHDGCSQAGIKKRG